MSETKFTPAPWELIEDDSSYPDLPNYYHWEVESVDGAHIAQNQFGGNDKETEKANARLIAVAPEIYDLLKEVEEEFEHEAKQKYYGYYNPSLQYKISKVLAKAKGDNE